MSSPLYGPALVEAINVSLDAVLTATGRRTPDERTYVRRQDLAYTIVEMNCLKTGLVTKNLNDLVSSGAKIEKARASDYLWAYTMSAEDKSVLASMCELFPDDSDEYQLYMLRYQREDENYYTLVVGEGKKPATGYIVHYWSVSDHVAPTLEGFLEASRKRAAALECIRSIDLWMDAPLPEKGSVKDLTKKKGDAWRTFWSRFVTVPSFLQKRMAVAILAVLFVTSAYSM